MNSGKSISAAVKSAVAGVLSELHDRAGCEKLGIDRERLAEILAEVAAKYLADEADESHARTLLLSLRVEELALARACAAGSNAAWEVFMLRYREKLYQSALRIARDDSAARELADSLYAELYGTTLRGGERASKLASFTGRGSLEGWLRTVVAQEFVNRYRRTRRLVSLEEENEEGVQFAAPEREAAPAADPRLEATTDAALAELANEDRFVLAAYYLDGRTLAEIARILGVHESTISRKVDKLGKSLRKKILTGLMQQGMSRRQAEEALEVDVRDLQINIRRSLAQETEGQAFPEKTQELGMEQKVVRRAKG